MACSIFSAFFPSACWVAAPGSGSIQWRLAAVDRKPFLADQALRVADQQHVAKHRGNFCGQFRDEGSNGCVVRLRIATKAP